MNSQLQKWHNDYRELIKASLIESIKAKVNKYALFQSEIISQHTLIEAHDLANPDSLQILAKYKKSLLKATSQLPDLCFKVADEEFKLFEKEATAFINALPDKISEAQSELRFKKLPDDNALVRTAKTFKTIGYGISKYPEKLANSFRRLRGKEIRSLRPWMHDIFLQDLAQYYLKEELKSVYDEIINIYYKAIADSTIGLWSKDELTDRVVAESYAHLKSTTESNYLDKQDNVDLESLKTHLEELVLNRFEKQWEKFEENYEKAGTIEFFNSRVKASRSKKLRTKVTKKYNVGNRGWLNTLRALQDDWEIDLELYELIYSSLHLFKANKERISDQIEQTVFKKLDTIEEYLQGCKKAIESIKSEKKVQLFLEQDIPEITTELRRLINLNSELLLNQELPQEIDRVGNIISQQIEKISTKRAVYKGNDYTKPIKSSALSNISPYELINFEYAPQLFNSIDETKQSTVTHINDAQNVLLQLAEVASFNLESAVSAIDENDEQKGKTIAISGLDRTIQQLTIIKTELTKILEDLDEKLLKTIHSFNGSIIKFTDNENILNLRVRIVKAKATERSKQWRRQIVENIRNLFPILMRMSKMYFNKTRELIQGNLKRLGIGAEKTAITTELADFLAQTEDAIDKLPFVYQRLFRALALEDDNFFEGRVKEINKLKDAYAQWGKKRFAASIIVGEKGGGISSLVNVFMNLSEVKAKKDFISPQQNIHDSQLLLGLFNEALKLKTASLGELVNELKTGKPRVIVLENIQRLYLKHVGGFDNIRSITELISVTSDKVFWVVSCTEFGFDYLNKTINLAENFGYTIHLESLSSTAVVELIGRRHNVSGYKLEFEPSEDDLTSKRYISLTAEERQEFLKKEFFNELNKIAKSNISIAMIYWLRSTKQTVENTITISSLKDMDFSFMKGLSVDKLYVLHMLLLHDGLTESEVSKVNSLSISQCRRILYPLYEDGIIIKTGDVYSINPLLYRQSINLLKTKNILH